MRLVKFTVYHEPSDVDDPGGKIALKRAVVVQAIVDATTRITAKSASVIKLERDQARAWLLTDRRDFPKTCEMGSLDPSAVRAAMQILALDGWRKPLHCSF